MLSACSTKKSASRTATNDRISPSYQGPKETDYCSSTVTYSGDTSTVSGTGEFIVREIDTVNQGLGAAETGSPKPIRYAEVRITNSSGSVVQCAETDANGDFSFILPRGSSTYTVSINSRALNNKLKASVLNAPERNNFYSLVTSVTPSSATNSVGTLTAQADDTLVLGAAFNILDMIYESNKYIRMEVCGNDTGCGTFTVAPKVSAYWELGFNPGSYFEGSGPLSFYLPDFSRLFILGGENGDIDSSDTDHFDNSVVIHEYGHFLEDVLSVSDSPGGSHNGNSVIDPRLAWSEGWGNFLQAAVLGDQYYTDTVGNVDGSTDFIFRINLEDLKTTAPNKSNDIPEFTGEGEFREFSVTRLLFDIADDATGVEPFAGPNDQTDQEFDVIWGIFTGNTGLKKSALAFRSIGFIHEIETGTNWGNLRTSELHNADRTEYAYYGEGDSTTCNTARNFSITPYDDPFDNGSFSTSHLLRNNDFFHYKHSGGNLTVTLNYLTSGGATEADLDLYLYNEDARFGVTNDIVNKSIQEPSTAAAGNVETEAFTESGLAAGDYLINVMVYTGAVSDADTTDYEILVNGERLCPTALP